MGLTAMFVGSFSGFGMQMMNNALQKVPLSRSYVAQRWVRLEKELVMDINEIRSDKGLPPMIATGAWIKYEKPE